MINLTCQFSTKSLFPAAMLMVILLLPSIAIGQKYKPSNPILDYRSLRQRVEDADSYVRLRKKMELKKSQGGNLQPSSVSKNIRARIDYQMLLKYLEKRRLNIPPHKPGGRTIFRY